MLVGRYACHWLSDVRNETATQAEGSERRIQRGRGEMDRFRDREIERYKNETRGRFFDFQDLIEKDGISTSDFPNDELLYFVPLPKGVNVNA